jgi:hypothetical protein
MQPHPIGTLKREHLAFVNRQLGARLVIDRIAEGHDGVEPVVATGELHDHQHAILRHARLAAGTHRGVRQRVARPA